MGWSRSHPDKFMLGILNCCPRALPRKHDGLVFPLRERLQRGNIVLVVRIGYRISRLAGRWLADLGRLRPERGCNAAKLKTETNCPTSVVTRARGGRRTSMRTSRRATAKQYLIFLWPRLALWSFRTLWTASIRKAGARLRKGQATENNDSVR